MLGVRSCGNGPERSIVVCGGNALSSTTVADANLSRSTLFSIFVLLVVTELTSLPVFELSPAQRDSGTQSCEEEVFFALLV